MTQLEILSLACDAARQIWCEDSQRKQEFPGFIHSARESESWKRLKELEDLWQAENKRVNG